MRHLVINDLYCVNRKKNCRTLFYLVCVLFCVFLTMYKKGWFWNSFLKRLLDINDLHCVWDFYISMIYRHSLWTVAPTKFLCLSVCVCVCPAFKAYISLTMGRILIKVGENVGTLARLIFWKFHKNQFSVDVIMTSFLYS